MERVIGIDGVTEEVANERVAKLTESFPGFEFVHRPHETRTQFVLTNMTPDVGQPKIDQMARIAAGG